MNALHRTEIRTYRDMQAQADLERMLTNRRAAERARETRFSKLRASRAVALKPESFGWVDSAVFLTPLAITAALILIARWSGWLS